MFNITEITLLNDVFYTIKQNIIPQLSEPWWLITPGYTRYHVCVVNKKGEIDEGYSFHVANEVGVRPVLQIKNENFNYVIGEKINIFNLNWTILEIKENEIIVLCDEIIGYSKFAADNNDWKKSMLKPKLENWLKNKTKNITNDVFDALYL